jgi:hypothetical protein
VAYRKLNQIADNGVPQHRRSRVVAVPRSNKLTARVRARRHFPRVYSPRRPAGPPRSVPEGAGVPLVRPPRCLQEHARRPALAADAGFLHLLHVQRPDPSLRTMTQRTRTRIGWIGRDIIPVGDRCYLRGKLPRPRGYSCRCPGSRSQVLGTELSPALPDPRRSRWREERSGNRMVTAQSLCRITLERVGP